MGSRKSVFRSSISIEIRYNRFRKVPFKGDELVLMLRQTCFRYNMPPYLSNIMMRNITMFDVIMICMSQDIMARDLYEIPDLYTDNFLLADSKYIVIYSRSDMPTFKFDIAILTGNETPCSFSKKDGVIVYGYYDITGSLTFDDEKVEAVVDI